MILNFYNVLKYVFIAYFKTRKKCVSYKFVKCKISSPLAESLEFLKRLQAFVLVFSFRNFNFCFFQQSAMQVVISSFLSSCWNPGWRMSVKSCLFEILFPLDSARTHNFSKTHVAYTGIKANIWIQIFKVEPQSPKVN